MTSPTTLAESTLISHPQREFLLQRLMQDSQRLRCERKSPSRDSGQRRRKGAPTKSADQTSGDVDLDEDEDHLSKSQNLQKHKHQRQKMFSNAFQLFNSPLHQYAATLAAAHFMQAAAAGYQSGDAAPLLEQYPLLYRSLFPATAFAHANGGIFENGLESGSCQNQNKSIPSTTEKRMASISLSSPQQTITPSPRKRAPPKMKESNSAESPALGSGLGSTPKKARAIRRIQFDDEMCSPVSGMYIKDMDECLIAPSPSSQGESEMSNQLDDSARWVEMTEEAKAELARIPNLIGDYICRLCKIKYADAFHLAKHRCPRIAHEEYRCSECDKVFSCPANLASHKRWHKPKDEEDKIQSKKVDIEKADLIDRVIVQFDQDSPIDLSNRDRDTNGKHTRENGNGLYKSDDHEEEKSIIDDKLIIDDNSITQDIISTPTYYECQTCGKRFDAHRWLRAHALTHTSFNIDQEIDRSISDQNGDRDEMQCDESGCRMWFLSIDALEKHRRCAHPKFACKFCTQSFPTSPALTRHINRQHPAPIGQCRVVLLPQQAAHALTNGSSAHQ